VRSERGKQRQRHRHGPEDHEHDEQHDFSVAEGSGPAPGLPDLSSMVKAPNLRIGALPAGLPADPVLLSELAAVQWPVKEP
jgi:hypothetical protein